LSQGSRPRANPKEVDDDGGQPVTWRTGAAALWLLLLAASRLAAQDQPAVVAEGERLFRVQGCYGCHTVGRFGTPIGPDLSRVGLKYSKDYLARWLTDPEAQRPHAHMPRLELDPAEVEALAAYLATRR
jgi:mono/diheme cytochrome c family protein